MSVFVCLRVKVCVVFARSLFAVVAVCRNRLFAITASGVFAEVDVASRTPVRWFPLNSGRAYALTATDRSVAVAVTEGVIK